MTTIAAFATAIGGLTVSGVKRSVDYSRVTVDRPDLPFQFVDLPGSASATEVVSTCNDLGKSRTVDLVVCVKAINQDNVHPNFDATVAIMDAIETALDAYEDTSALIISYEISAGLREVGGLPYWAVTASVTGTDT